MPRQEAAATRGAARSRHLRFRIGTELADARRAAGLSLREVGRRLGVSAQRIARAERGELGALTIDMAARMAAIVGLQLAAALHPNGDPVRDRGHLALLDRLRSRLGTSARLRTEVPVPIAGDLRSGDAMVKVHGAEGPADVLIEAETRIDDIQLVERRSAAKQRDLGAKRLVLLVADTRHNRSVLERHPELRERFPVVPRTALAALAERKDPGGDALVML
jgi:transcriptional regulator with XRE-family HTH domain